LTSPRADDFSAQTKTIMTTAESEVFMRRAIVLARRAWGDTHPNPHVGALIVEGGRVVAEGWHERAGGPHAEICALRALGRKPAPDAALVVTLEPCCTHGRTGACTDAILAAGIRRVVAGATDPFPAHSGRGFALLREAGVSVAAGVLARECEDLNLIFNHSVAHGGAPFVALKTATTLDGRIATRAGKSQWITGPEARADVMRWRRYFPAAAVSAATVLADNPRLTCRIAGEPECCPVRFVFDRRLRTAGREGLHVFEDAFAGKTVVVTTAETAADAAGEAGGEAGGEGVAAGEAAGGVAEEEVRATAATAGVVAAERTRSVAQTILSVSELSALTAERARALATFAARGVAVWQLPAATDEVFFSAFKARCVEAGLSGIWVEGGGTFLGAWLRSGEADCVFFYSAPKIIADAAALPAFAGADCPSLAGISVLRNVRREIFGDDLLTRGFL
jgi:diaminohydroxyphosphoribosylaminopyrimidine deaminase/5-amino-6-(5-phosphoribosylamino)uracil reductase